MRDFVRDKDGRKKKVSLLTKGILNFEKALKSKPKDGIFSAPNFLRKPTIYGVDCNIADEGTPRFVTFMPLKGLRNEMEKSAPTVNQPILRSRVSNTTQFSSSDTISAESTPSEAYLCEGDSIDNEILPQSWSSPATTASPNRPWFKVPSSPKGASELFDMSDLFDKLNDSGSPPEQEIPIPLSPPTLRRFIIT